MSDTCIRVGIADDDELIRLVLIRALGKWNNIRLVDAVEDGEQAVHLASSGRIDVLLLDVEMPKMTGAQALPIIRLVAPAVKVIMHSSRCSQDAAEFLNQGAAGCLAKPCDIARIVEAIRSAVIAEGADLRH